MELIVWLWAFDKRLLSWCNHSPYFHVYVWLLPTILATTTLIFTYVAQVMKPGENPQCYAYPETEETGRQLK